jgi:hypothetical protein
LTSTDIWFERCCQRAVRWCDGAGRSATDSTWRHSSDIRRGLNTPRQRRSGPGVQDRPYRLNADDFIASVDWFVAESSIYTRSAQDTTVVRNPSEERAPPALDAVVVGSNDVFGANHEQRVQNRLRALRTTVRVALWRQLSCDATAGVHKGVRDGPAGAVVRYARSWRHERAWNVPYALFTPAGDVHQVRLAHGLNAQCRRRSEAGGTAERSWTGSPDQTISDVLMPTVRCTALPSSMIW